MTNAQNSVYYRHRAEQEQQRATAATLEVAAIIHRMLADNYTRLADQAERRQDVAYGGSDIDR
jgi:hypothetical protein